MQTIFFVIELLVMILTSLTNGSKDGLTQIELRAKYGQVGTSFNDGKSCYRTCDGEIKTCYYEFHAQIYDTLNSQCDLCSNEVLSHCFKEGCIPGNGVERVIMTINQKLPGPAINVCKGDRIIVDVTNHMAGQGLTIHWHGIHQVKTPWMDGIPMVTQCPIDTGDSFRYAFYASEGGTHFWHAHSGLHRSNGIVGALVIREPNDPNAALYDYDLAEHNILISDWDNHMAEDEEPGTRSVLIPLPKSALINGFGSYHNAKTNKYKFSPMEVFYVQRGKRHRFRITSAASHICQFEIAIKDYNLTVIATDGFPVEPFVTDRLVLSPGERFDIVMSAKNDPNINKILLTVRTCGACILAGIQEFARIIFVDDISNHPKKIDDHKPLAKRPAYETLTHLLFGPKRKLNEPFTNCVTPNCYCIAALQQKNVSNSIGNNLRNVEPYKVIPLHFKMVPVQKQPFEYINVFSFANVATINRIANSQSPVPGLVQDDSNVGYCNASNLPEKSDLARDNKAVYHCPHRIELELDKVYEFLLIDDTTYELVSHPIHMHGYAFQVIDMGTLQQLESGKTPFAKATHPPVIKDTVIIPRNGFVRIRFRTTNPGYWLLHCHIEYHQPPGMALIVNVGNKKDIQPPPANFPTCGNYFVPIDE